MKEKVFNNYLFTAFTVLCRQVLNKLCWCNKENIFKKNIKQIIGICKQTTTQRNQLLSKLYNTEKKQTSCTRISFQVCMCLFVYRSWQKLLFLSMICVSIIQDKYFSWSNWMWALQKRMENPLSLFPLVTTLLKLSMRIFSAVLTTSAYSS